MTKRTRRYIECKNCSRADWRSGTRYCAYKSFGKRVYGVGATVTLCGSGLDWTGLGLHMNQGAWAQASCFRTVSNRLFV